MLGSKLLYAFKIHLCATRACLSYITRHDYIFFLFFIADLLRIYEIKIFVISNVKHKLNFCRYLAFLCLSEKDKLFHFYSCKLNWLFVSINYDTICGIKIVFNIATGTRLMHSLLMKWFIYIFFHIWLSCCRKLFRTATQFPMSVI